jgi:hypothetical protein
MAQLTISIPDEYIPGIEAARNVENNNGSSFVTAEEYANHVALQAAISWCEKYKVGPNWIQPQPDFNPDGTPYVPVVEEPVVEEPMVEEPVVEEPIVEEPVEEPVVEDL